MNPYSQRDGIHTHVVRPGSLEGVCVGISQASWIKSGGWSSKENRVPLPEEGVWVLGSKIIVLITDCQKDLNPFFPPEYNKHCINKSKNK